MKTGEGIITIEEINRILTMYRIGKKPLSLLLGWGETTIMRYMDGDKPTKEYSERLSTIGKNPYEYFQILEKYKQCLTKVAYRKSKDAVMQLIFGKKIYCIAQYLFDLFEGEITQRYTNYLLYYAQSFSLALYDEPLFEEDCKLSKSRLPYEEAYEHLVQEGAYHIKESERYLNEHEKLVCYHMYKAFSWYGIKTLSSMVDLEMNKIINSREERKSPEIQKEELKSFYRNVLKEHNIKSIREVLKYPVNMLDRMIQE